MTTVVFGFPAGLYHATPWGHHVNEGLVEWPPSPWRLLRALVSVGYTALGWDDGVPPTARALLDALASVPPRYVLPKASLGHARHYMPLGVLDKGREKTTLVFDAFARPGDGILAVTWPVALDDDARALLASLVRHLGYLGRSESWVEGRLLDADEVSPRGDECWPCDDGPAPSVRGWDQVHLLAVQEATAYREWREREVAQALGSPDLAAPASGRIPPKLAERRQKAEAVYPIDLWSCVTTTTADLQGSGWSRPPGSRALLYWRRADALEVTATTAPRPHEPDRVEAILLAMTLPSGNTHALPAVARTLPQAELIHRAAVSRLGRGRRAEAGLELIGRDDQGRPLQGHRHGHVLPLDLDGDGHLDHVLVWAPAGFGAEARNAVRGLRETWAKGAPDRIRLAVAATGPIRSLLDVPGKEGVALRKALAPSTRWRTASPFVPPRHLKKGGPNSLAGQVAAELASRGLPAPTGVRVFDRDEALDARLRHFVRERAHGGRPPATRDWFGLELVFDVPVSGPLSLGYASHFGLGRFEAA